MEWIVSGVVAICLIVSALFSAAETALNAASRASMVRLEKQASVEAAILLQLFAERARVAGTVLIGKAFANVIVTILIAGGLIACFGEWGALYAVIAALLAVVLVGDILPRTIAARAPDRVALLLARPVRFATLVLAPLHTAGQAIADGLLRILGRPLLRHPSMSAAERLRGAVDLIRHDGGVEKSDRDMLSGLLDLNELHVSDVMVHRTEMVKINADLPSEEIVREVLKTEYTRIPLWREKPENIVGVLHAKDLLRALRLANGDLSRIDVNAIMLPPWFVPDMRPLSDQLKAFRRRKTHFALVVDEYGEVEGLVTLEDILEEIVGDIADEHDVVAAGVRTQPDGSVVVDGAVPIRDLNRAMDWQLPDDEATTIAGLVIHESRSIPQRGQNFTFHGFRFRVLRRERNRITALRIMPIPRADLPSAPLRARQAGTSF